MSKLLCCAFVRAVTSMLAQTELGKIGTVPCPMVGLAASAVVSPIYVFITNPISRLEVIMQTSKIQEKEIGLVAALKELGNDMKEFGMRGVRGKNRPTTAITKAA